MKRIFDEEFYKSLYRTISDMALEYCPLSLDEKVVNLDIFEFRGLTVEVDLDANIEIIDDSFTHEFGVERCFHLALGEINFITCRLYDDEGEVPIDNEKLNFYLKEEKRLVKEQQYLKAYNLTK